VATTFTAPDWSGPLTLTEYPFSASASVGRVDVAALPAAVKPAARIDPATPATAAVLPPRLRCLFHVVS
jgi:hypothetical protein